MAPKAARLGQPDLRHLGRGATPARAARAQLFELATEAVWAAEPADVSLLHVLFYTHSGGGFNTLLGTGGGAQQDRFHGGSQRLALLMAEELGAERVRLGAPVRRIEHGEPAYAVRCAVTPDGDRSAQSRRADRARAAGDRRDPADPGRAGRLRPAAAGPARPADPADAAGHGDQDDGDLRAAVLARGGALRAGEPATPARPASSSTTHRPTAAPASCSASSRDGWRGSGAPATRASGARRSSPATPASSARGRRDPSASSSGSGPRRSGPAAATAA